MKPRQLYRQQFSPENLKAIFHDRIARTATTGKDGISPAAFETILDEEVSRVISKSHAKSYRFTAYKQKLVLKGAGKPPREISIATVRDRVTLRAITNILMEVFADTKLQAPHYFIQEISDLIRPLGDEFSFVQIDIKDFYPSISHDLLMKRLRSRIRTPEALYMIDCAVKTPTGSRDKDNAIPKGVPQGLSISNILSAIYMIRFDHLMRSYYSYFRYVDDIIIICRTEKAERALHFVSKKLKEMELICHPYTPGSKTKIATLSKGVEYLGYTLKPGHISVRSSSYRRMMENIMAVITYAKHTANERKVMRRINLKITGCIFDGKRMGWMFFFSLTSDIRQLKRLDSFVSYSWRKAGLEKFGKPKTFVKAYYEIRYNFARSTYIPRFDEYTLEQKAQLIADMEVKNYHDVRSWTEDRINKAFLRLVRKEVAELEKDVTPVS